MSVANIITAVRVLLIPAFMLFLLIGTPTGSLVALFVFCLAAVSDKVDGYIARRYNQITDIGKLADPLADKLLVLSALLIFVSQGRMSPVAAAIILSRELAVTSLRVVAVSAGKIMAADLSGKIKTVVQMVGIILILLLPAAREYVFPWIDIPLADALLSWTMTAVTIWSGFMYFYNYRALFRSGKERK